LLFYLTLFIFHSFISIFFSLTNHRSGWEAETKNKFFIFLLRYTKLEMEELMCSGTEIIITLGFFAFIVAVSVYSVINDSGAGIEPRNFKRFGEFNPDLTPYFFEEP
jgi:hypothetical protein